MAQASTREEFVERATAEPFDHMTDSDQEYIAREIDIIPVDANKSDEIATDMSWGEQHIGGGGPLTVTDYGRHRKSCDTLADFREFIRDELADGFPSQYLKVMDDDKESVAEQLVAISRSNGYVVLPLFE